MIAIADVSGELNGAKLVTQWFLRELTREGIKVVVFDTLPRNKRAYKFKRGLLGLRAIYFLAWSRIRGERNLYLPLAGGSYLIFHLGYLVLANLMGYQVYLHHHSYSYINRKTFVPKVLFKRVYLNVIQIFLTQKMRDDFEYVYGRVNLALVLSNAIVLEELNANEGNTGQVTSKGKIKLVHFGRLSSTKGSDLVLELYSMLLNMGSEVSCLLVGEVKEREIEKRILELKKVIPGSFTHIEKYTPFDIPQILIDCDVFLFPSKYQNEAAPLVVYEAQFNGLVCYTSKAGSLDSIVIEPGITVPIEDWINSTLKEILRIASLDRRKTSSLSVFSRDKVALAMRIEAKNARITWREILINILKHEPPNSHTNKRLP